MTTHESFRLPRTQRAILFVVLTALGGLVRPCHADVVTDWDAKASAVASPAALGERELAIVDLAMFDAVNSLARQYRTYLDREDGFGGASPEAAAASAAATALEKLHPQTAADCVHRHILKSQKSRLNEFDQREREAAVPQDVESFMDQIRAELAGLSDLAGFRVAWEWLPPWRPADMTDAGRDQLRAIGFSLREL